MSIKETITYLSKAVFLGLFMAAIFLFLNYLVNTNNPISSLFQVRNPQSVELSFAQAVRRAAPAVVNIYSINIDRQRPLQTGSLQGLGSGVLMSQRGFILTNYHVIKKADEIIVALQDGRQYRSEIIGLDPETDLAVIKVQGEHLPVVPINLAVPPQVGDVVLAIGNPYNLGQTITQGIISATGRNGLSSGYQDFLQTDAAINAGNSGGALIDTNGALIGINTAAFQIGGESGGHGINFAIPIKLAYSIMEKLIKDGRVIRGALGMTGKALTIELAQILNLPDRQGVFVIDTDKNGPAAIAGLKANDIIIKFNEEKIPSVNMLMDKIAETTPGTKVELTILRRGKRQNLFVTVGEKQTNYQ